MTARTKAQVLEGLTAGGIVPVIRADSADTAVRIVEALVAGGIRTLEITMTVPDAIGAIRAVADSSGATVLLGAGTVTSRALAEGSIDAGAEFLVTPCVVPEVIAVARERGVAVLPGAMTRNSAPASIEPSAERPARDGSRAPERRVASKRSATVRIAPMGASARHRDLERSEFRGQPRASTIFTAVSAITVQQLHPVRHRGWPVSAPGERDADGAHRINGNHGQVLRGPVPRDPQ